MLSEVLEGSLEAIAELEARAVAEDLSGSRYVGLRVADIPRPSLDLTNCDVLSRERPKLVEELVDRDPPAAGDVEHMPGRAVTLHRESCGRDHVRDVGEVARLLPVAENGHRPARERAADEVG